MLQSQRYDYYVRAKDFFRNSNTHIRSFLYKNYSYGTHVHDFYEINIVLKGTGIHILSDRKIHVKAGDVFVIPPFIPHSYTNENELTVFHYVVSQELIKSHYDEGKKVQGFLQLMEIEPYLRGMVDINAFLHLSPARLRKFTDDIQFERSENHINDTETTPLMIHSFFTVLYRFAEYLHNQINTQTSPGTKYSDQIIKVLEYIHSNYEQTIYTDDLCRLCFMSRSTFLRAFSQICGCTPREYLIAYRNRKATELVESSKYSKTQIAHMCGFYDLSHMERSLDNQAEKK